MSRLTRLMNWFRVNRLNRDLRDEVAFHLEMRASQYCKQGMPEEEAMKRANEQFGDTNAATRGMRKARLTSVAAVLAVASILGASMLWTAIDVSSRATLS